MIRVNVMDDAFNRAYHNARRALPIERLERPRQYGERWREAFRCRPDSNSDCSEIYYVFDQDADYTWFMLQWG
jgi:hypothetical protein